jgi:colicin import membrane protein
MVYAMAKRVIEVDASLTAIGKTHSDFSEITDKQDEVITTQTQVAKRLEELGKSMANMPTVVATEANKSSDLKFKDMQKQLTAMESKLQSFDGKLQTIADKASARLQPPPPPAPVAPQGPSTQVLLNEIQKLKIELNVAMQGRERAQSAAEVNALKAIDKNLEKSAIVVGEAQKAADKAAQSAKASAQSEKAALDAQRAALEAQRSAAASEKAAAAERIAQQKAAAERAVAMRMQPEKPVKSAEQIAEEKAAAEKAAAARAAKVAAEKAAAEKAAAAERAAAEKARAAAAAAPPPAVREKPIQYPRVPD